MKPIIARSKQKPIIMEVVNVNGNTVDEYKDDGVDKKPPYHFIVERASL